jgi:hypothetical protein
LETRSAAAVARAEFRAPMMRPKKSEVNNWSDQLTWVFRSPILAWSDQITV